MLFWLIFMVAMPDFVFKTHSQWFEMSRGQFNLIHYGGMLFMKLCLFVFFLLPYAAIKLVLRGQKT